MPISPSPWKKSRPNPPPDKKYSRSERGRKVSVRPKSGGGPGRTVAASRELSPLARLEHTSREEKIRFQIVGMSGAILQGVPATTLDTDIWKYVGRPKDVAHLPLREQALKLQRHLRRGRKT